MSLFYAGHANKADELAASNGREWQDIPAGTFEGFGGALLESPARGFAEIGRAAAVAGSVVPIAYDLVRGVNESSSQDWYFQNVVDDKFNRAVDYWTPRQQEVGAAGQMASGLGSGLTQLAVGLGNPALLVGTQQLGTGTELVREGVDAQTAQDVGMLVGAANAVGAWMPMFGGTVLSKIGISAASNAALGAGQRAATGEILEGGGYDEIAKNYNAWDAGAILTDAALGAAFGYVGRNQKVGDITEGIIGARAADAFTRVADDTVRAFLDTGGKLSRAEKDMAAAMGNRKSLIVDSAPGRPINDDAALAHESAMLSAVDSLLGGKPFDVSQHFTGREQFDQRPVDVEASQDFIAAARELGIDMDAVEPAPIEAPTIEPAADFESVEPLAVDASMTVNEALRSVQRHKGLQVENDKGLMVSAAEEMVQSISDHQAAIQLEKGFKAAALCVLGG